MSFTTDVKNEILDGLCESDCCVLSSICACINTIGSLEINHSGKTFSVKTDNESLLTKLQMLIEKLYGKIGQELTIESKVQGKIVLNELVVPVKIGSRVLVDCGILKLDDGNNWTLVKGIDHHLIIEDCCKKAYIKMAFLCIGNISVPRADASQDNKRSGYHFELEFTNNEQAKAVSNLLGEFGFMTRKVERGDKFVVYMKDSESIGDFLAFIGATKCYLEFQDEVVKREVRNSINRQSNCISANIGKTVNASLVQMKAIAVIEQTIGIDSLPEDLREIVNLRKNNPDSSLSKLIELFDNKLTKSGLNYKLKRLVEIAEKL